MNEQWILKGEMVRDWLARERRRVSWLAEQLNVSATTVTRILGGYVPKYRTLLALAQLMGVTEVELLIPRESARVG